MAQRVTSIAAQVESTETAQSRRVTAVSLHVESTETTATRRITAIALMVEYIQLPSPPGGGAGGGAGAITASTTQSGQTAQAQAATPAQPGQAATAGQTAQTQAQPGQSTGALSSTTPAGAGSFGVTSARASSAAGGSGASSPGSTGGAAGGSQSSSAASGGAGATSSGSPAGSFGIVGSAASGRTSLPGSGRGGMTPTRRGATSSAYSLQGAKMPELSITFDNRSYAGRLAPNLTYTVSRYSWAAIGGPENAAITATGDPANMWQLLDMLRCGVWIRDGQGREIWWGYINAVDVSIGGVMISASLGDLWNSIDVQYTALAAASSGPGTATKTGFSTNTISSGTYGTRELIISGTDVSTATAAEALRSRALEVWQYPAMQFDTRAGAANGATIHCVGWYKSLDWQYYTNASTADVATTTQIGAIVTASGQFLTATDIIDASGISTNEYRDGNKRAGDEIASLLKQGVSGGRRLLATVTMDRRLKVYQEPAQAAAGYWWLKGSAELRDPYSRIIYPHQCPAAMWVRVSDILPGNADGFILSQPGAFFVERAEYDARSNRVVFTPRGQPDPLDLVRLDME